MEGQCLVIAKDPAPEGTGSLCINGKRDVKKDAVLDIGKDNQPSEGDELQWRNMIASGKKSRNG
ncbi:hypothetical protein D3C73_1388000 [compost metagenome]